MMSHRPDPSLSPGGAIVLAPAGLFCVAEKLAGLFQLPLHSPRKTIVPVEPAKLGTQSARRTAPADPFPWVLAYAPAPVLLVEPVYTGLCDIRDFSDHQDAPSPSSARTNGCRMAAARTRRHANAMARCAFVRSRWKNVLSDLHANSADEMPLRYRHINAG